MNEENLLNQLRREPIVNVHCHHLQDGDHRMLTLQSLLNHSYVGWCTPTVPDGTDRAAVEQWLGAVENRSFFRSLERGLQDLYGLQDRLTFDTWSTFDAAIRRAHLDPDWHLRCMQECCRYETVFLDAFWNPGDDNGHPALFRPAYRCNCWFLGYNNRVRDHNGHNAQEILGVHTRDLDEYLGLLDRELLRRHEAGASVIKLALAYDRDLKFGTATRAQAQRAMCDNPTQEDVTAFQDYLIHHFCEKSAEYGIPMQIHTGLGEMKDTRAIGLRDLIKAHPETTFILMHGSYPWTADILGLTNTYNNVYADLCWLPLISPFAAHRFLHELMDVCNADRMLWGCDTWTCEESFGARETFLRVLARVLTQRVELGVMYEEDVLPFARKLLHENGRRLLSTGK